jgi:type III secretion inner rod protein HrpB2
MTQIDSITAVAAISPAGPVTGSVHAAEFGLPIHTLPGPSMEELTGRFRAMMEAPQQGDRPPAGPQQSLLTNMMANGEEFLRQTHEKVAELRAQTPYMTPPELVAATIEVSEAVSIGHFRLQAATSIASGTNKSLQSLLKNQ